MLEPLGYLQLERELMENKYVHIQTFEISSKATLNDQRGQGSFKGQINVLLGIVYTCFQNVAFGTLYLKHSGCHSKRLTE